MDYFLCSSFVVFSKTILNKSLCLSSDLHIYKLNQSNYYHTFLFESEKPNLMIAIMKKYHSVSRRINEMSLLIILWNVDSIAPNAATFTEFCSQLKKTVISDRILL